LDGFAIVPLLTGDPGDTDPSGNSKWPAPRLANPPIERQPALRHSVADTDEDERELERILQFKRGQKVRVGSWLILAALVTAIFVLFLQLPTLKALMTRTDPAGSPSAEQTSESPRASQTPAVDEAPSSPAQTRTPPAETSTPPAQTSASPPRVGGAESPESAPPRDTRAERQAATDTIARVSPGRAGRASSSSIANVRAPDAARIEGPRFRGLPRVELIRNSVSTAEGKADAYVVRVSDTSGRPLTGADVLLLIRMDDGTVENMTLRAGPEPGTYQGTAPHSRSSPVDLRLRMMVKDSRIEIPLSP
jgi:cytoskeletal protein RodZ